MVEAEAAKDSSRNEAAEAGSMALASLLMLGYAQSPALQPSPGTRLMAEVSFAGTPSHVPEEQTNPQYQ